MDPGESVKDFDSREIQTQFGFDKKVQEMKVKFQWHLSIVGRDGWETWVYARMYFENWEGRETKVHDSSQLFLGGQAIR